MFCRLVRVFVYISSDQRRFALALVQPFHASTMANRSNHDSPLGLCRIHEKPRRQSFVIPARSIIRGCIIVEDTRYSKEYTVADTLDEDMFLRLMPLFPNREMEIVR